MMIGLERGVVRVEPYNAQWKRLFEEEKARLQTAIGQHVLDIQHVGSTAIPGMIAKPIVDIGIAVTSFEAASVCVQPVEQLGYEYRGEHMNEIGSRDWENQVLFRDYLIQHLGLAEEYATLKAGLARQYPTDRDAYTDGKAHFIERVLGMARAAA
jgi:GrpB-like predicted nucleotidyltransferase (UPF0157 family)